MDDLINKDYVRWLDSKTIDSNIVISSRVRLARNLQSLPFPHLLNEEKGTRCLNLIHNAWLNIKKNGSDLEWVNFENFSDLDKTILVEKHLLSPAYIKNAKAWQSFVVNKDGALSVMINEEDHLRLQCLLPGLQLRECLKEVLSLDDLLENELDFAFDERRGYLTACPTNVGTGMRASVMLHLPAIKLTGQLNAVIQNIAQLGMTVRGLYGEGSEALGDFYQVSNQVTLGQTEEDICNYLQVLTRQLVQQEKILRQNLQQKMKDQLEDRVKRAYGILKYAHMISSHEAWNLLSDLRLGMDMQYITGIQNNSLNELMVAISPAHLQKKAGKQLSVIERDCLRAQIIQEKLNNI